MYLSDDCNIYSRGFDWSTTLNKCFQALSLRTGYELGFSSGTLTYNVHLQKGELIEAHEGAGLDFRQNGVVFQMPEKNYEPSYEAHRVHTACAWHGRPAAKNALTNIARF